MTSETRVVTSRSGLRAAYSGLSPATRRAVVLTMGALHAGHAQLVREARARVGPDGHVTVTVFVNPAQFAPGEDLARYPRTLEADVELCAREGADLVFAPSAEAIYRDGAPTVTVDPGPLGTLLEGAIRPGHFRGVLTVVAKLISLTSPDLVVFGEKDYQQLVLVRRMVRDLDLAVQVVGVETVRDADRLATSSRNVFLTDQQRRVAVVVPQALDVGVSTARAGGTARDVVSAVQTFLDEHPDVITDYAVVTDPDLGAPPETGSARLILAVRVGDVRLLDNAPLELGDSA